MGRIAIQALDCFSIPLPHFYPFTALSISRALQVMAVACIPRHTTSLSTIDTDT